MATLAEMMFQNASKSISESTPDVMEAYKTGAQLALKQQELDQQSAKLEAQMKQAKEKSVGETIKVVQTALKFSNEADQRRFLKNALPKAAQAYETQDIFTPELVDMLTNSADSRKAMAFIADKVRSGEVTVEQGMQFLSEQGLGEAIEYKTMQDAAKFAQEEKNKTKRAEIMAGFKETAATKEFERTTAKRVKTAAGDDFGQYQLTGGKAALEQNAIDLNDAIVKLKSGAVSTGGLSTKFPYLKSDDVQSMLNQEMLNVEVAARKAIMPLLRATLGAQFTENEGERIFGTVFDRKAPATENARRMEAKLKELKATLKNKEDLFIKEGLITEEQRTVFGDEKKKAPPKTPPKEIKAAYFRMNDQSKKALAEKYNMTMEQLKKMMEAE